MPLGHPSVDLRRQFATWKRSGPAGDRNLAVKRLWVVLKTRRPDIIAKVWKWSKDRGLEQVKMEKSGGWGRASRREEVQSNVVFWKPSEERCQGGGSHHRIHGVSCCPKARRQDLRGFLLDAVRVWMNWQGPWVREEGWQERMRQKKWKH